MKAKYKIPPLIFHLPQSDLINPIDWTNESSSKSINHCNGKHQKVPNKSHPAGSNNCMSDALIQYPWHWRSTIILPWCALYMSFIQKLFYTNIIIIIIVPSLQMYYKSRFLESESQFFLIKKTWWNQLILKIWEKLLVCKVLRIN